MKPYSIFGAGVMGTKLLSEIGIYNVNYFIDNDMSKQGNFISNIKIIGLQEYIDSQLNDIILIPYGKYSLEVIKQLKDNGIFSARIYMTRSKNESVLIVNPYVDGGGITYAHAQSEYNRILTNEYALQLHEEKMLFDSVEIETYNRCNGMCDFCPVNVKSDTRIEERMDIDLFKKIIMELSMIEYDGALCLHSNNEPFMDERIVDMQEYVREKLPKAFLHLYTNGTLLSLEKFKDIITYLDQIIIDNYNDRLVLNDRIKQIAEYCTIHSELISKVTIVLRKQHEVLTSRGGDSPNVTPVSKYGDDRCILPFKQLIIRPSGEVSLCCNDPLGKYTLGDLNAQSILEVWNGVKYREIRTKILDGRKNILKCKFCDTFFE